MLYLFLALIISASGADSVTQAIEQAQSLALKKNRREACRLLHKTIQATPTALKSRSKLVESLAQIAKVFFTDKGQKAYEAAASTMWENPELALTQFRSALELEDGNILLQQNIARVQLLRNDCDGALTTIRSARDLNPFDGESAVLELRGYACQQAYETMREKAKSLPLLDRWQDSYVQLLFAQDALSQKAWRKAFDYAVKISELEPQFPESYLVLAKAAVELNKDAEPYMQKYVSLCKGLTIRERKRFALEPRLCTSLKEIEDVLSKKRGET